MQFVQPLSRSTSTSAPRASAISVVLLVLFGMGCGESTTSPPDAETARTQTTGMVATDFDLTFDAVELRSGATADIHVQVSMNEARPCRDPARTALFIHGVNATAASWDPFVEAFFSGDAGNQLCLIAAMDHAGHGDSGLPVGSVLFGELMVEDYARTLMGVLERLRSRGIRPSILVGHSQGTSTIQTAQEMLLDREETLRGRYGVRDVVFLGTQGPAELPVEFLLPEEPVAELIGSLVRTTPEKGTFVHGPPSLFQELWFINLNLELSSAAPSLEEIAENGWNSDVPLFATLQAAGQGGFTTPSVRSGAFRSELGTRLHNVDFADDPWSLTQRAREIHEYLTGDPSLRGFVSLSDPDNEAVHDYMTTHPEVVREAIALPR